MTQTLGILLVLLVPGAALVAATGTRGVLGWPLSLAVAAGTSIALTAVTGVALHAARVPITGPRQIAGLAGVAVVGLLIVALRTPREIRTARTGASVRPHDAAFWGAAVAFTAAALVISVDSERARDARVLYAELSARPLDPGAARVVVSIRNAAPVRTYVLSVRVADEASVTRRVLTLRAGERWEATVATPVAPVGGRVVVRLTAQRQASETLEVEVRL